MLRLTEQAQQVVRAVIASGDVAIDATAGNGHDTLFLAQLVGETGRVFACDVQEEALARTACRLEAAFVRNVVLLQRSHADMKSAIPPEYHGHIGAVMFNLGYLPGGDKTRTTTRASSEGGVRAAISLLRPGGIVTVLAYPGHAGGAEETAAVEGWLHQLNPAQYAVTIPTFPITTVPRLSHAVRIY